MIFRRFPTTFQSRAFIKFLFRRSVGFFSWAFLVFLMKECKKRRWKHPGKLMAKSCSQPVNLPGAWPLMNPLPKISEDFPKLLQRPDECTCTFSKNFRKFPTMSEVFLRLPNTFEEDPKMFWWYTNKFKYNYFKRQTWYQWNHRYLHSYVKISYLNMWGYRIIFINLLPLAIPLTFM